ncbi:MAG: DUF4402 domain-containing protein [Alphaproteobacteria bacterium]|nr:DUF4402 domain-containing protein [Alphaproteobacteria bacterium]
MRKYFLLSAVAMLATSTANATTDFAEMTARATIEYANVFEFTDLNFGTITLATDKYDIELPLSCTGDVEYYPSDGAVVNVTGADAARLKVTSKVPNIDNLILPSDGDVELLGDNGTIVLKNVHKCAESDDGSDLSIGATILIPASTPAGTYVNSFVIMATYE